jgi:hypothetical protein
MDEEMIERKKDIIQGGTTKRITLIIAVLLLAATGTAQISQSLQSGNLEFQNSSSGDILTVFPNGNVSVPGSINVGSCSGCAGGGSAETLSETLSSGNDAGDNNINMTGNNITEVQKIEFEDAGGELLNVDQLSLSQGDTNYKLRVGGEKFLDDGFEDGTLSPFSNDAGNDVDWSITSSTEYGSYAAEAGDPGDDNLSRLNLDVSDGTRVVFRYYLDTTSSNYEDAVFSDSTESHVLTNTSGNWRIVGFEIPKGSKTLSWEIDSDSFGDQTTTTFRIDDVRVFNTTQKAVSVYGTQSMNTGELNQVDRISMVQGIEIGYNSNASDLDATAIGSEANASGVKSSAIGYSSLASGEGSASLGMDAEAKGSSIAVGKSSSASSESVAVGLSSDSLGTKSAALGHFSNAQGLRSIGLGSSASSNEDYSIAMGYNSGSGDDESYISGGYGSIAIGSDLDEDGIGAIANTAYGANKSIAIGADARSDSSAGINQPTAHRDAIAIGRKSLSEGGGAIALGGDFDGDGTGAKTSAEGAVAIGADAVADESYTVELGSDSRSYNLSVHGDIVASGDITSQGNADLAEIYSSEKNYSAGTVVSISSGEKEVEETDERFEDVAGVISKEPGFVLNKGEVEDGVEVALEGRVPVKVAEEVEKGEDLAAGVNGKAVPCKTEDIELSGSASNSEIVEAVNSLSRNQACLKSSFGEALNSSRNGYVEVMLD